LRDIELGRVNGRWKINEVSETREAKRKDGTVLTGRARWSEKTTIYYITEQYKVKIILSYYISSTVAAN